MYKNILVIAEVKTASPFGFRSAVNWEHLFEVAREVGDIVSVHTDPRWGGSFDLIRKAKRMTDKPILAKGIHESDDQINMAVEAGADRVLVVGRVPGVHTALCFVEPLTLVELAGLPEGTQVVWNSRDIFSKDGGEKIETFDEAREVWSGWLCQASNITSAADIKEGANAVLVGSHLEEFARSIARS